MCDCEKNSLGKENRQTGPLWYAVKVGHCHLSLRWFGRVQQATTANCSPCYIRIAPCAANDLGLLFAVGIPDFSS